MEETKQGHCWNEEKQEWYPTESIGINQYRCLGCYERCSE